MLNNRIFNIELSYHREVFASRYSSRWIKAVGLFGGVISVYILIIHLAYSFSLLSVHTTTLDRLDISRMGSFFGFYIIPFYILVPITIFYTAYTIYITLVLSFQSIVNQKTEKRWELLLLTPVSTRQMVFSKWLAVASIVLPHYFICGILYTGAALYFGLIAPRIQFVSSPYLMFGLEWPRWRVEISVIVLTTLALLMLMLLQGLMTTAIGITAGIITENGSMLTAFITRFVPFILLSFVLFAVLPYNSDHIYIPADAEQAPQALLENGEFSTVPLLNEALLDGKGAVSWINTFVATAMLDSGLRLGVATVGYMPVAARSIDGTDTLYLYFFISFVLIAVIYLAVTLGLLFLSNRILVSKYGNRKSIKIKG